MACILTDAHEYGRSEKRPEIPKEPLCMPVRAHRILIIKKSAAWAAVIVFMLAGLFGGEQLEKRYYDAHPEKPRPKRKSRQMPWYGLVSFIIGFGGIMFYTNKLDKSAYDKLRNPMLNPRGYKYQGRVLSSKEPHYLLHLNYYRTNKTWTLPDEIEQSGAFEYDNTDAENWELEADMELFNNFSVKR